MQPETAYGVAAGLLLLLLWWSPTVQTTRVQLMFAAALVFGLGVELLRRQTAREIPAPPPPDLGGSARRAWAGSEGGRPTTIGWRRWRVLAGCTSRAC